MNWDPRQFVTVPVSSGTVTVLSAATGAGKTLVVLNTAAALLRRAPAGQVVLIVSTCEKTEEIVEKLLQLEVDETLLATGIRIVEPHDGPQMFRAIAEQASAEPLAAVVVDELDSASGTFFHRSAQASAGAGTRPGHYDVWRTGLALHEVATGYPDHALARITGSGFKMLGGLRTYAPIPVLLAANLHPRSTDVLADLGIRRQYTLGAERNSLLEQPVAR